MPERPLPERERLFCVCVAGGRGIKDWSINRNVLYVFYVDSRNIEQIIEHF